MRNVKILIATIFQNAGDATRAIEIAKVLRDSAPEGIIPEITFISRGSRFEQVAKDEGFQIYEASPRFEGLQYQEDFRSKFGELIGDPTLAKQLIASEMNVYKDYCPDLLIHGFWPVGSIARRMVIPNTPHACFLPIPLTESFMDMLTSFPDEMLLSRLPLGWQRFIIRHVPKGMRGRLPALRHSNIRRAALSLGWQGEDLTNIFTMLRSGLYLINDFPIFYDQGSFPKEFLFTGPVFSAPTQSDIEEPQIRDILSRENSRLKVYCTLGSSGNKKALIEVVKMFDTPIGHEWSGIILSPKGICPIEEAKAVSRNPNVYITDKFVPALDINKQVDVVVCHGGQGTLQTAIMSQTPLVGIATQPEQKINLDNLQNFGSAIRIPQHRWKASHIARCVQKVSRQPSFKRQAQKLYTEALKTTPHATIARYLWQLLALEEKGLA